MSRLTPAPESYVAGADIVTLSFGSMVNCEGGCYLTTKFPLPRYTRVQLILQMYGMKIPAQGEVRVCDDGHGMDITFTTLEKESELRVKKAVQRLAQGIQSATPESRNRQASSSDAQILEEIRAWFDHHLTMTRKTSSISRFALRAAW